MMTDSIEEEDIGAYNNLSLQLERELNEHSLIEWHIDRYDERLGDRSDEVLEKPEESLVSPSYFILEQMRVGFKINIERDILRGHFLIVRDIIEDRLINYISIIKQIVADQIATELVERRIV